MDYHPTATRVRKRRSTASGSPEDDGDDSRKRGRPRVEKQDESPADRRRTQIRMAQRAYRQRKESTLDELRRRVSELTNTAELMHKAFVDCHDRLKASDLPQTCMQDIGQTSIQFQALIKSARDPGDEPVCDVAQGIHRNSTSTVDVADAENKPTEAQNVPSWMDESALSAPPKPRAPMEVGLGYTMYLQGSHDVSSSLEYPNAMDDQTLAQIPLAKDSGTDDFDAFRVEVPDMLFASMSPPRTYSSQETTFARRLHRTCLEQAYELLTDPQRRPATYNRVFKLSLMTRDRSKLAAVIKAKLDTGPHGLLDMTAPLIHVGGAGTHYPRRDQFGNLQPKKQSWNLGIVGPQTLALLENAARDNLTTHMTVEIAGFEGEWFDPYDVEGYLAEKGIYIDPSSSFAEIEVLDYAQHIEKASPEFTLPASPESLDGFLQIAEAARPFDLEQLATLSRDNATPKDWSDFSAVDLPAVGFSDADTGSWLNFLEPGKNIKRHAPTDVAQQPDIELSKAMAWDNIDADTMMADMSAQSIRMSTIESKDEGGIRAQMKRSIMIDVAKFVKLMTVSGVCIGRSPGFRRTDVDRALALSSFSVF